MAVSFDILSAQNCLSFPTSKNSFYRFAFYFLFFFVILLKYGFKNKQ
jgi:hypothetical protein